MDSFSSSVQPIQGYNHAVVFVDYNSGFHTSFQWLYDIKNKIDLPKIVKTWNSDIADLRQRHTLVVVMRNNAGENKSQEILDFFESVGVKNISLSLWESRLISVRLMSSGKTDLLKQLSTR